MHKVMVIRFIISAHVSGGGIGPETATCSCTARVLESHLARFRTSMTLNKGRVSDQLLGAISISRHILYGVHVK